MGGLSGLPRARDGGCGWPAGRLQLVHFRGSRSRLRGWVSGRRGGCESMALLTGGLAGDEVLELLARGEGPPTRRTPWDEESVKYSFDGGPMKYKPTRRTLPRRSEASPRPGDPRDAPSQGRPGSQAGYDVAPEVDYSLLIPWATESPTWSNAPLTCSVLVGRWAVFPTRDSIYRGTIDVTAIKIWLRDR